jgi:hypothetical protein
VLFTFPSRYSFAIGRQGYLALEGGPPSFPLDSSCPVVLALAPPADASLPLLGCHHLWPAFPGAFRSRCVFSNCRRGGPPRGRCGCQPRSLNPWPVSQVSRFGLLPVRSPLLGESRLMSFPPGTEMFQFPDWPLLHQELPGMTRVGLPHSDVSGSTLASSSPLLFAANHVLLRPLTP